MVLPGSGGDDWNRSHQGSRRWIETKPIALWVYIGIGGWIMRNALWVYIPIGCIMWNALWERHSCWCSRKPQQRHSRRWAKDWSTVSISQLLRFHIGDKKVKDKLHNSWGTQNTFKIRIGMDSSVFDKTNLCNITPCNEYRQMQNKFSLTDRRKYSCCCTSINIFLEATQRTGLPTTEITGLRHATGSIT